MKTSQALKIRIEELRKEMAALQKQEEEEREAIKKATKRRWHFTFEKVAYTDLWRKLRPDCGASTYRLSGTVKNIEECLSVGYGSDQLKGSMDYLVNDLNGRIIRSDGGGSLFITGDGSFRGKDEDPGPVYLALEKAVAAGEEDVTEIIMQQEKFNWA